MAGIYIHIPFCKQACAYCNFHFVTSLRHKNALLNALQKELLHRKNYLNGAPIETIYIGGGTPSLLSSREIGALLSQVKQCFSCLPGMEVTLEVNPDDVSLEKLNRWHQVGVNRISMGIQSFQPKFLKLMRRAHNADEAHAAIKALVASPFTNYSLDLIYGLMGQDLVDWAADLSQLLRYRPPHFSAYCLTIEPNTWIGHRVARGDLQPLSDAALRAQFDLLYKLSKKAGYEAYEVSNFCLPNHHSRHNSRYWEAVPYLGIGPGAHSYNGKKRHKNPRNNQLYTMRLAADRLPLETEDLEPIDEINAYLLTSLRTLKGANLAFLYDRWGYDLKRSQQETLHMLKEKGLIQQNDHVLSVTEAGRFLSDGVAAALFLEDKQQLGSVARSLGEKTDA